MRFHEEQAFMSNRISWLAPAGAAVALAILALSVGHAWWAGESLPASWPLLFPTLVLAGVLFLFWRGRMTTEVDEAAIRVEVYPLTRRHRFAFEELASCHARTYRPLREYGGWGVRCGLRGRAYNVSGNRGVQLVFRDGRRLLLGSQRADELAEAIHASARARTPAVPLERPDPLADDQRRAPTK